MVGKFLQVGLGPKGFLLQGVQKLWNFILPTPKLREKHFSAVKLTAKYQISTSREAKSPLAPSNDHGNTPYHYTRQGLWHPGGKSVPKSSRHRNRRVPVRRAAASFHCPPLCHPTSLSLFSKRSPRDNCALGLLQKQKKTRALFRIPTDWC